MRKVYPKHIYEPIRIKIACTYIKREFRKYLPNIKNQNVWINIDSEIDSWFSKMGPRDFWNGFHGIAMGFKLKHHLTHVLTAENVKWKLVDKLPLDENIAAGAGLGYISNELSKKKPTADETRKYFQNNPRVAEKWLKFFKKEASSTTHRDRFPIIAVEKKLDDKEIISIHDGNRRFALWILEGRNTISAYVGKYISNEKTPKNFWLPTSWLMDTVYNAGISNSSEYVKPYLKNLIKLSKSGEYELMERVLIGNSESRKKLKKDLKSDK